MEFPPLIDSHRHLLPSPFDALCEAESPSDHTETWLVDFDCCFCEGFCEGLQYAMLDIPIEQDPRCWVEPGASC